MNFLTGFLLGAAPGIVIYVVGVYDYKDWLWILSAGAKEKLLSKVRKATGRFSGKE